MKKGIYTLLLSSLISFGLMTRAGTQVPCDPQAAFSYNATDYCQNGTNPVITITGSQGFWALVQSGGPTLSLNADSGAINLAASSPGTYQVANTVSGGCGRRRSRHYRGDRRTDHRRFAQGDRVLCPGGDPRPEYLRFWFRQQRRRHGSAGIHLSGRCCCRRNQFLVGYGNHGLYQLFRFPAYLCQRQRPQRRRERCARAFQEWSGDRRFW